MAKNFIQKASVIDTPPGGAVVGGTVNLMTDYAGIWLRDDDGTSVTVPMQVDGAWELAKNNTEAFAVGDKLYWDGTQLTTTSQVGGYVGRCARADLAGATLGVVNLNAGIS